MKVDGLGVILAIILLPIILVVTYYIQLQVDTIAKENSYNTKLLNATYDAMLAFEKNTANEELSSVADSLRSIILASNNTFFNTLATNLGMSNASQENLRPYVPAILYTMYDGYYIYSPAETAVVGEKLEKNGELITTKGCLAVGDVGVKYESGYKYRYPETDTSYKDTTNYSDYGLLLYKERKSEAEKTKWKTNYYTTDKNKAMVDTDYILKPYTQYSARYVKGNIDVTINYTLDNYITVEGTIGGVYYTKSGYLIKKGLVSNFIHGSGSNEKTILLNDIDDTSQYSADELKNKILNGWDENLRLKINNTETISISFNNIKYFLEKFGFDINDINTIEDAEKYLKKAMDKYDNESEQQRKSEYLSYIQNIQYEIQKYNAVAYYVSSAIFSNWVYKNLGDLTYDDIIEENNIMLGTTQKSKLEDFYYKFKGNNTPIFKKNATEFEDPEDVTSNFNTHRIEVIKNSIKYNLNQSISAYANLKGSPEGYSLPVLTDSEWDNVLSKISIVSFMQGWDCGLDVYNNYEIAYSTNNEFSVTPSEIYYVPKDQFNNENDEYHRIDCPDLESTTEYIAFKSNEIKYDRLPNPAGGYKYDHKNLACYTCINNNNYTSEFGNKAMNTSYYARINNLSNENKVKAGYIGLGAMRQSTYKTNALTVSEGYKVDNITAGAITNDSSLFGSEKNYKYSVDSNVKKVLLTFSNPIYLNDDVNYHPTSFNITIGSETKTINLASYYNTILVDGPGTNSDIILKIYDSENGNHKFSINLESIKFIYK